jgi:hypothetical protein
MYSFLFEIGSFCVVQAGLELLILLLQPPEYWDYRHVPPLLVRFFTSLYNVIITPLDIGHCSLV